MAFQVQQGFLEQSYMLRILMYTVIVLSIWI